MLKKLARLALLGLCLLAVACATTAGTPLQQANGRWALSFDETINASQELRDLIEADPDMEQYMRESMQGLILTIDIDRNIMVLSVEGENDDKSEFTVVSESVEDNQLVLDIGGDEFTLWLKGDRMEWVESGETLVFQRIK